MYLELAGRQIKLKYNISEYPTAGFVLEMGKKENSMDGLPSGYRPNVGVCLINDDNMIAGDHKTNVMGTLNTLGLAKRVGARFLLTSTSEVYGDLLSIHKLRLTGAMSIPLVRESSILTG